MAIRYSGDVEIRMLHKHGPVFHVAVRTPRERGAWDVNCRKSHRKGAGIPPEEYDRIALIVLQAFEKRHPGKLPFERDKSSGRVTFRRVFQAPCPQR